MAIDSSGLLGTRSSFAYTKPLATTPMPKELTAPTNDMRNADRVTLSKNGASIRDMHLSVDVNPANKDLNTTGNFWVFTGSGIRREAGEFTPHNYTVVHTAPDGKQATLSGTVYGNNGGGDCFRQFNPLPGTHSITATVDDQTRTTTFTVPPEPGGTSKYS